MLLLFGSFFLLFGILIIIFPNIVAYLVAFLFIIIGINIIALYLFSKKFGVKNGVVIGDYKVVKK